MQALLDRKPKVYRAYLPTYPHYQPVHCPGSEEAPETAKGLKNTT